MRNELNNVIIKMPWWFLCCAASIHSLATPVGSLLSGPLLDAIGRRGSLQLSAIPLGIGWLIIGFSKNVTCLLVGRLICGVSVGLMAVPSQVISENLCKR